MAKILCIGIATLDIINEVEAYPSQDDEIRIVSQHQCRGGNATNTAVVLSQLGHECHWLGTMVNEADSQLIYQDLDKYAINYQNCQVLSSGKIPTSYITLSRANGSRTICHYRDLPELSFEHFRQFKLDTFDWIHFEGRNIDQTLKMMQHCKQLPPQIPISVEIEKPRENIEQLFEPADCIIFSKHYCISKNFKTASHFCKKMASDYPEKKIFCAWGHSGAAAILNQDYYWEPAQSIEAVDTLAAGDVFNAGVIDAIIMRHPIPSCIKQACRLAEKKCTLKGIRIV